MAVYGYTKNYKLIKPQFDTDTWHDYEYDNLDTIDAVLSAIFASGDWQGFWKTNTHYDAGGVVIDRNTDTMYKIMVEHTTSEATFAEEFAANPTYYELWSPNNLAEDWAIKMDGQVSNTDYSSKAYAISSGLIDAGSAKEWAINSGVIGDTGEYSAKKYATDAHNDYISMTTDVNVIAVGANIANVNTVGQSISNVNTVASDISSVNTVAGISTDVTTVASIANAVSNVSGIESEVLDVSDNRTDISTVASNISDVNTVADISTDVSTVADNDANVTTVATNISDVNTAAANIAAIQAAPTAATNAAASATLAQEWASKMDGQVASTDYSSKYYAGQSATSADNSHVWAEGTDEQVQALGGVHSSKGWADAMDVSHFVTTDTAQAITGNKTFTAATYAKTGGTYSTTPATDQTYAYVEAQDSANKKTATWGSYTNTSGTTHAYMNAYNPDDNTKVANVSVLVTSAGLAQTYATSPNSATANDQQIATTSWVRNHRCTSIPTTSSTASEDAPAYVVINYKNSSGQWYRKYSDGFIEQSGPLTLGTYGYNFLTSFSTTPTVLCSRFSTTATTAGVPDVVDLKAQASTTGFTLAGSNFNSTYFVGGRWFACGY